MAALELYFLRSICS